MELPNNLVISLSGVYPKELKARSQTEICIPVFIAALLFTTAERWKKPKGPVIDACVNSRYTQHHVVL
jgi:hypothetical protein